MLGRNVAGLRRALLGGRRWWAALAVALIAVATAHFGSQPARADHLCGNTGSSAGSFNFQTYEDKDWRTTYSRVLTLAGRDRLFTDVPEFALPKLETGNRAAGSGQLVAPSIPPTILKAIAWIESSWTQADWSVDYGSVGKVLISHDCGYGLMQITSGMQNKTGVATLEQAMIGGHYAFNVARGAAILAEKWNAAPTFRPIVGSRDPTKVESWYYAIWGYNGFSFKNHPLNPALPFPRAAYRCDGTQPRSNYPYQELVLGCVANPPVVEGKALWSPLAVSLPNLSDPAFSLTNWDACSNNSNCAAMDIATPSPAHVDSANTSYSQAQVIGSPELSVSTRHISMVAIPPVKQGVASLVISNNRTGPLAWRISTSASWLKVSRTQGVALGTDLRPQTSTITVRADATGLAPGRYTATLTVESLWASGAPLAVSVILDNYPDGTLLQASGSPVYVMRGGIKRPIPNRVAFEASGFQWSNVLSIPDSVLAAISSGQPLLDAMRDGNLLKGSSPEIYVMEARKKRLIRNTTVLSTCGYSWEAVQTISDGLLNGITRGPDLGGSPCPRLIPPSNTLVRNGAGYAYVVRQGLKRTVPNMLSFDAYGFLWGNVNQMADSIVDGIPTGQPLLNARRDGNLLKGSGPEVYVMEGGQRRLIRNTKVFSECGYDWDAVRTVTDWRLEAITRGADLSGLPCPHLIPPSDTVVRNSVGGIYVMQQGLKRAIPNIISFEASDFSWGNVEQLPDSVINAIPTGRPLLNVLADGNLLRASGPEIYVMEGGQRRLVRNTSVFSECGYGWDAVRTVTDTRLERVSRGPDLSSPPCPSFRPPSGSLIRGSAPNIYVVEAGEKRLIESDAVFIACGYQAGNINAIADGQLEGIPDGVVLTEEPCP